MMRTLERGSWRYRFLPPPKGSEDIRESIGEGRAQRYKYTKIGRSCEVRLAEVTAAALWG